MLLPTIKYPLGIQTFSKIIEGKYLYVDKTLRVYQLAKSFKYVFLSRPRRFGKSLLISTLKSYFEGRRELFGGLAIERHEKEWARHPVLRFDLSGASYDSPEVLRNKLSSYLSGMERIYGVSGALEIGDRFRDIIEAAHASAGQRAVILIDEYDKPMLDTMHDEALHESIKSVLRGFYSVLKESDEHIRFAMITGVSKFGKVSIFSGLNNLKDISMLPDYNDICGITEREFRDNFGPSLQLFADANGVTPAQAAEEFKAFYDGYHFAKRGDDIYNPYSTINAFADNEFKSYWFATGSSNYLIGLIRRNNFFMQDMEGARRKEGVLSDITVRSGDIVPLLYQAGYLTIKGYDPKSMTYTLGLPNREVSQAFWDTLGEYFFRSGRNMTEFDLNKFVTALDRGDAEDFMLRLKSMFASIPNEQEPDKEVHFQNMITILVKMLGYCVRTEVHSSRGRSDIEIETPRHIYIMELKVGSSAREAMAQIHERGYARRHEIDPRPKILIGASFSPRTRTFSGWEIEHIG